MSSSIVINEGTDAIAEAVSSGVKPSESLNSPQFHLKKSSDVQGNKKNKNETKQSIELSANEEKSSKTVEFIVPQVKIQASSDVATDDDDDDDSYTNVTTKTISESVVNTERDVVKDLYQVNNDDLDNWYHDFDFTQFDRLNILNTNFVIILFHYGLNLAYLYTPYTLYCRHIDSLLL